MKWIEIPEGEDAKQERLAELYKRLDALVLFVAQERAEIINEIEAIERSLAKSYVVRTGESNE